MVGRKQGNNRNGFYTVSKKDIYTDIQHIKRKVDKLDIGFTNHLENHQGNERKNRWILGIVITTITVLINIIAMAVKGG